MACGEPNPKDSPCFPLLSPSKCNYENAKHNSEIMHTKGAGTSAEFPLTPSSVVQNLAISSRISLNMKLYKTSLK